MNGVDRAKGRGGVGREGDGPSTPGRLRSLHSKGRAMVLAGPVPGPPGGQRTAQRRTALAPGSLQGGVRPRLFRRSLGPPQTPRLHAAQELRAIAF